MVDSSPGRAGTRARIVADAARLLREQGPQAVTTRGVAEAAGVQAPTIYRLFGDKDGLLEAVAEAAMAEQVAAKAAAAAAAIVAGVDPVADLVDAWRSQIEFGTANAALFRLLSDPDRVHRSAAARAGREVLAARVHRLATAGRLRVEERRTVDLLQAAGVGAIQTLLTTSADDRDPGLADQLLAAVLDRVLVDAPDRATDGPTPSAIALRAAAPHLPGLTDAERGLIAEWLDRAIAAS